jgi:hypothetical protein
MIVTSDQFNEIKKIIDEPLADASRFERLFSRPSPFGKRIEFTQGDLTCDDSE